MDRKDPQRNAYRPPVHAPADAGSSAVFPAEETRRSAITAAPPAGATVCVVGLGYVGLPLAVAFDDTGRDVVGYDVDRSKVETLRSGNDPTGDVGSGPVADASVRFTAEPDPIEDADYVIITVPTPIDDLENPDLEFVRSAGRTVGEHVTPGTTVVLESTVYPGATEDVLAPAVEGTSGLTAGEEFFLGYSPERASPGEEGRGVRDVVKIVGANADHVREPLAELYETVVDAGVYRAPDIRTAEAAKVIENVQRDLNIALVNELAIVCESMGLSTEEVLDAAGTKWNFHDEYSPGLVGGHCIPVDPHYLAHRVEREGFSPKLILQAREINEHVPTHTAELTVKALNESGKVLRDSEVLVLGFSYKPNVGDVRTSEVSGVVAGLREYDVDVVVFEPHADDDHVSEQFDVPVQPEFDPSGFDGIVLATAHDEFRSYDLDAVADEMNPDPVLMDVPGLFSPDAVDGFTYRRL